jgi:uncharacterized protein YuzE
MPKDIFKEVENMKIKYSTDADICIIELRSGKLHDSIDLKEGVILHIDKKGAPIEIEIIDASKYISFDEFSFLIPKNIINKQADALRT